MKNNLFLFAILLFMGLTNTISAQSTKVIAEKEKEIVDASASKVDTKASEKGEAIPDQYIILFDESLVPPFSKTNESAIADRDQKKKAADAYEKKMEVQIKKIAQDKLGITPSMIKSVFSSATTGIVVQLKNEHAKGLKTKLAQMKEVAAMGLDFKLSIAVDKTQKPIIASFNPFVAQSIGWGTGWVGYTNYTGNKWAFILDTGIDLAHPDLNVGAAYGGNFSTSGTLNDLNGHGTHCAGIIAGRNNTFGTVGVAADARVIPVKVINDNGYLTWSQAINGLNHVAKYCIPGDVVNMSFGGGAPNWFEDLFGVGDGIQMERCIRNLANSGVHMVIAAGNSSAHANGYTPARVEGTRIYTVSSADWYLNMSSFSNHGNGPCDYAAPGSSIYSTYKNGTYAYLSGTSMAAPFVAGILLANNGIINTRGTLYWDRDGNRDRLAVRQ